MRHVNRDCHIFTCMHRHQRQPKTVRQSHSAGLQLASLMNMDHIKISKNLAPFPTQKTSPHAWCFDKTRHSLATIYGSVLLSLVFLANRIRTNQPSPRGLYFPARPSAPSLTTQSRHRPRRINIRKIAIRISQFITRYLIYYILYTTFWLFLDPLCYTEAA